MLAQKLDLLPSDINVGHSNQKVLEEFYRLHGRPNEAELAFLERTLHIRSGVINEWSK